MRVCPGCGNLVPADVADCPYCGYGPGEAMAARPEAAKEDEFFSALFARSNPFTFFFIGVNLAVFLLEWLSGGMGATTADTATLVAFGAKVNYLIDQQHQYWRFITANFIHIGFLHLLLNNYALWILGQEVERIYGSARFVVLYILTGVLGVLASYFYSDTTSAGASTSIYGLAGVIATFAFRYRKEIPEILSREIKQRVLPIIAINLVFGFSVSFVDNAGHLGGLASGIALALVIPYKRPQETKTPAYWRAFQALLLVITSASFVLAFINYNGPRPSLANLTRKSGDEARVYFERMQEGITTLSRAFNSMAQTLNESAPSNSAQKANRELNGVIQSLNDVGPINQEADGFRVRLINMLTEQKGIFEAYAESSGAKRELVTRHNALGKETDSFLDEYNKWIVEFMKGRGYELRDTETGDRK